MTTVRREAFGRMPPEQGGGEVEKFVLQSDSVRVEILSFGCIITTLETKDREGQFSDVVLGFDTLEGMFLGKKKLKPTVRQFNRHLLVYCHTG